MKQEIKERIELINKGIVPAGYKKTLVGICPIEWETSKLSELSTFVGGGTPSTKNRSYWEGNIPWISSSDISDEGIYNIFVKKFINEESINNSATKLIPEDSILVVTRVGVGKLAINTVKICTSQDFTNLINIKINKKFLAFYLKELINKNLKNTQGTSIKGITTKELGNYEIFSNNILEQQKIAEILDCATRQVELQEQLVDKLKVQKKALMQKLLTPQPDWQKVKLGEICKITTGKMDANDMVEDGDYPFFTCSKDIYKIDKYAYDMEALLMAGNGEIGDIKYYNGKFNAYQRTYILYNFKLNIKYVMQYLLLHFNKAVCKGVQKSSMPYIRVDLLNNAQILFPKNLDIIAKTLDCFDQQTELQQKLLEQYKLRQKSLMQLLLTGIVRVG